MRHIDEYRDAGSARKLFDAIRTITKRPWTIMEICGGQTHTIVRSGMESLLPKEISLVHGPGCPVCVTPLEMIDRALSIARRPDVIFTSFGDMLRVPGSTTDLLSVKAEGGDVRIVYSPLDAIAIAQQNPGRKVVFFAVGFETTAPANAMSVWQARKMGLRNFSLLCSHVLVPPAMKAILSSPVNRVQAFLAAGHVCAVVGYEEYIQLGGTYNVPIIVTGFEPIDILQGIFLAVKQLEGNLCFVENQYRRAVRREGNKAAIELIHTVFEVCDRKWRGIGEIPLSGYKLRSEFADYDAEAVFDVRGVEARESSECMAGTVLQGLKKPYECPAFGLKCIPEHPLGAPMVSSEGACSAYFRYARVGVER